ncbi:MAG: hypothetical protein HY059_22050 [Proteobacteria bacterium]|nr:hypothetical protein [Pseudomonadota bacterium]
MLFARFVRLASLSLFAAASVFAQPEAPRRSPRAELSYLTGLASGLSETASRERARASIDALSRRIDRGLDDESARAGFYRDVDGIVDWMNWELAAERQRMIASLFSGWARDQSAGPPRADGPPPVPAPVPVETPAPQPPEAPRAPAPQADLRGGFVGRAYRTRNFFVTASDPYFAKQAAERAEQARFDQAIAWFGRPIPDQRSPIRMSVNVSNGGGYSGVTRMVGGGASSSISVTGSRAAILGAVIPHEVQHTLIHHALGFGVPDWFHEGASTLEQSAASRAGRRREFANALRSGRAVGLSTLFRMGHSYLLYTQGYSVTEYLVERARERGGNPKAAVLQFVSDGARGRNWEAASRRHFGVGLAELQRDWLHWHRSGSPTTQ